MNRVRFFFVLSITTLFAHQAYAQTENFKVNGRLVTKNAQEEVIKTFTARGAQRTPQLEERVKYMLARNAMILEMAKQDKVQKRPSVRKAINTATEAILINEVIKDWVKQNPVPENEIQELFKKEKERWGDTEVLVQHILLKDEKKARDLLERVKKGESMSVLAREHSIDVVQNRRAGGIIDWTSPNFFSKEFSESFKDLKPGELVNDVVKTPLGWHIIRLQGRRMAERFKDISTHRASLTQLLTQQKVQLHFDQLLKSAKLEGVSTVTPNPVAKAAPKAKSASAPKNN